MIATLPWLAALLLVASSPCCLADDWPQWRGPRRDGVSFEHISTNGVGNPRQCWSFMVGTGFSGVSIAQGRAYTLGNTNSQDSVWCLDAKTGQLLWKHTYPAQLSPQWYEGGPGATPTISSNQVFTISKWGNIFCFDAAHGSVIWSHDLREDGFKPNRWGFAGSPLVWQDLVIFNAGGTGTAFNRSTGRIVWSNGTNATGYASPTLFQSGSKEAVLIFAAQHLVALDPRTGTELWRYPWKTDWDTNNSDPIRYKDGIFLSSFSRGCTLLSAGSGTPEAVYDNKRVCNNLSPGVVLDDYYYVFSGEAKKDTELRCLDLRSGQLKWTTKEPAFGSVISVSGDLLVLTEKGELLLYPRPASGLSERSTTAILPAPEPVVRAQVLSGTCWTPPSLANGLLYVRNAKGQVCCLDVSAR